VCSISVKKGTDIMETRLQRKLWIHRFAGLLAVALLAGCGTSGDGSPGTGVSAAVRVSGTPTIGGLGSVNAFAWAPDSSRIAYLARQETTAQELFITTSESAADNVKVSGPLTDGANVDLFAWSPNLAITNRIAYLADQDKINVPELYTSRPDGTANQNVSGPLATGGRVRAFFEWVPPSVQPGTLVLSWSAR
jgi:hypothetical protein